MGKNVAMLCPLIGLSDELHLNVIDALLEHDSVCYQEALDAENRDVNVFIERDDDFEPHRDLMNWSCTSSYFRNLLAPYIFKVVKLSNDVESGASVHALVNGSHGFLIEKLNFIGMVPERRTKGEMEEALAYGFYNDNGEVETDEEMSEDTVALPNVVETLLSNLRQFPNLESVSIGFTYPYESSFDEWDDERDMVNYEDSIEGRKWRALMSTTYEVLSRNGRTPSFKAIEIRKFVWTNTVPYQDNPDNALFHQLLNQMESFTLSIRGGDNGAGWKINTCDEYLECVTHLDEYFFNHLKSCTSLTLKAPEEGPIGLEGMRHARLALEPGQMPILRELHLNHIFICQELVDFVFAHSGTMERLTLHDCKSSVNGVETSPSFYWKDFFNGLHEANLEKLSLLEILPLDPPLTPDEDYCNLEEDPKEPVEVQQARRSLRANERRLFAYGTLDDKYGMNFADEDENLAAFERGEDQTAYDRLMKKLDRNASKSSISFE